MYKDAAKTKQSLQRETELFFRKLDTSRRIDESFARPEDEPLTEDEKRAVDEYWGRYKFAYPNIDYKSFQTFKNRCGSFDVRHCPGAIRTSHFKKYFIDANYNSAFQNKAMLGLLYPDIRQPKTVIRRMGGLFYDEDYQPISRSAAIEICLQRLRQKRSLIAKPNNRGGGAGIVFLDSRDSNSDSVAKVINGFGSGGVLLLYRKCCSRVGLWLGSTQRRSIPYGLQHYCSRENFMFLPHCFALAQWEAMSITGAQGARFWASMSKQEDVMIGC